jgi:hypothetical protein
LLSGKGSGSGESEDDKKGDGSLRYDNRSLPDSVYLPIDERLGGSRVRDLKAPAHPVKQATARTRAKARANTGVHRIALRAQAQDDGEKQTTAKAKGKSNGAGKF